VNTARYRFLVMMILFAMLMAGCKGLTLAGEATQPQSTAPTKAESIALTLPGDDWGFPSPFAFYSRGPGYIRMSLIFDTLTWKDADGSIPWLAKTWESSEDGLEWTFHLHSDVAWHDGRPLTAADVAFTYQYFKGHREAFKWSWPVDKVASVAAADDQTVTIRLAEPVAGCHESLFGSLPIIPRHIWEGIDDPVKFMADEALVGTGPFTLDTYSKEEARYVYAANEDYFQGPPAVDPLIFVKVDNQAVALQTGTTDYASFWGKEIEAVEAFEADASTAVIDGPSFWVLQLIFNTQRPPFDRLAVRQAVAHAVDRQRIVDQVTHGGAIVASLGIISPFSEWHNPDLPAYAHDPSAAQTALENLSADALSVELVTTAGFAREAELVQADLEAAGFDVTLQTGDRSTIDGLLREGSFDLAISGHGGIANPAILRSPTWPAETYGNDAYTDLYAEQARTTDEAARSEMVAQLQQIVAEDLPVLTLYHPKMWTVYDPAVLDSWFYTQGGVGFGIPISMNKLIFLGK